MSGIAGFIDYLPNGKPYMGLVIETDLAKIQIFLADKVSAAGTAKALADQILAMAQDLRKTPDKLQGVSGDISSILGNHMPQGGKRNG